MFWQSLCVVPASTLLTFCTERTHPGRSSHLPALCACTPADASTADFSLSMNDFPEFGPLRSFTPMVSHNGSSGASAGRSHPFALMTAPGAVAGGGGGAGSSSGYGDRGSLRTSQDISMLLRSGMLMEAALLSSNASRMHVIHDAGEQGRRTQQCQLVVVKREGGLVAVVTAAAVVAVPAAVPSSCSCQEALQAAGRARGACGALTPGGAQEAALVGTGGARGGGHGGHGRGRSCRRSGGKAPPGGVCLGRRGEGERQVQPTHSRPSHT